MKRSEVEKILNETLSSKKPDNSVLDDARLVMSASMPKRKGLLKKRLFAVSGAALAAFVTIFVVAFAVIPALTKKGNASYRMEQLSDSRTADVNAGDDIDNGAFADNMADFTLSETMPSDFMFYIAWGEYGKNSYNSYDSMLVLRDEELNTLGETQMTLSYEDTLKVYEALYDMDYCSYPDTYELPKVKKDTSHYSSITIAIRFADKLRTVVCPYIPDDYAPRYGSAEYAFITAAKTVSDIIIATNEWKSISE
ncbi:MAG: hypothetical protein J5762_04220 [Clostridia bacterium]|nr:hypothetical protein [Clostridia bacterium]